jgi:D-inositol-3-phosphate glycosyltransferase
MRIHLVSEHASPLALLGGVDAGGQNVHVAALAQALAARGDEVVVHTRRDDPALPRRVPFADGVVVDHVDAGPPEPIAKDDLLGHMGAFARDLRRSWAQERPDVVHAHFWMSGLAALDAGRAEGVPVALTYHALGAEKRRHQGADDTSPDGRIEMERWLARSVDRVIATTAAECRTLVADGAPARRVSVIPCGVDLDRFGPSGPLHSPNRGPGVRHRVVCVSRLVPRKGIEDVVTAVAGLPDVELLIAGGPPAAMLSDDPYAEELLAAARALGAEDRVHLLGAVDHDQIPGLLRSADVVCCTPWYEPFGLVGVEAMACGTPVVATAVGGLAETVDDGRTGILVPPRRPASVRAAIAAIVDHPRRRDSMRLAALARATRYGWPAIAERTREVFGELMHPSTTAVHRLPIHRPATIGGVA